MLPNEIHIIERIYIVTTLITALGSFCLGLFVYFQNKKKTLNRIYLLMSLTLGFWSMGLFFYLMSPDKVTALFLNRLLHIAAIFIPVTVLHFMFSLSGILKEKIKIVKGSYILCLILTSFVFTPLFIKDVEPKFFFRLWPMPGVIYPLFLLFFFIYISYAWMLAFRLHKRSRGTKRMQLKYILIGLTIGFAGGATNYAYFYNIPIPPVGNFFICVYVIVYAYAIVKYRLMDIKVVVARTGIFVIVYALVLGIPFSLAGWGKFWLINVFGQNWFWLPMFILLGSATAGPFIYQYLRRRAEDLLLKEQHRYQNILHNLSKSMIRIKDLDALIKTVTSTMVDIVKVGYAAIYLKEDEYKSYQLKRFYPKETKEKFQEFVSYEHSFIKTLSSEKRPLSSEDIGSQDKINLDSGLVIPYFVEDSLLGFLVLGAKSKGQMYTTDDILVLETISYSTSLAIENCRFWQDIENRQRKARLQEMDTYSYSLAHEIDNPMQVILGQAEVIKKDVLKNVSDKNKAKEISGSFDFILEAADRVSKMVKAIRDFGSPTTGELKPLKIQDIVESFAKLYFPQFKSNGIYFEKYLPDKAIFIKGEKPELMQVLVILANNAIHACLATSEKKIVLTVEPANHDKVKIAVKDNGYGIKKELLPVIFSSFTTTKASTEGTGMGLYNAVKIVEKHKGKIWAESEGEGKGATFFVELPIAKDITGEDVKKEDKGKRLF